VVLVVGAVTVGSVSLSSALQHHDGFPTAVDQITTQTSTSATTTTLPYTFPDGSPSMEQPIDSTAGGPAAVAAVTPGSTAAKTKPPTTTTARRAGGSSGAPTTRPPSTRPPSPPPAPAPAPPAPPPANSEQQKVVNLVNAERGKVGCRPVNVDQRLVMAAQLHSDDMSANNYFSHTSLDGRTFDQRIKAAGYPNPAAENIAKGQRSAEQVMSAWMNSSGHRANILNCGLATIGVGLDTDGWYWTQDFGR
jgi:uncharacterized protein YkwD